MAGLAHFAFGFAAKPLKPKVPLAVWLIGSELLDILALALLWAGIENSNQAFWSHSLLMAVGWGLVFGLAVWGIARDAKAGALAFGVVVAHWILDAIVWPMTVIYPGRPHAVMPLFPGDPRGIGLGLYRFLPAVILGEGGLFLGGIAVYVIFLVRRKRASKA